MGWGSKHYQPDPAWWITGAHQGRPLLAILRERDFGSVFCFLRTRGWSRSAIAASTGLSENRVRAISNGQQRITSYEVLERVATGLRIERGLIGLAYTDVKGTAGVGSFPLTISGRTMTAWRSAMDPLDGLMPLRRRR